MSLYLKVFLYTRFIDMSTHSIVFYRTIKKSHYQKGIVTSKILIAIFCVPAGLLLAVVGTGSPWLLWSPPGWLSPRAVMVLVAARTCGAHKHFLSPLLQNTSSVALLCLNHKPQTPEDSSYIVMTHLPLSPNPDPLLLGTWHPDTFLSFNDVFKDQFQDFGGKVLRVTNSVNDAPLVFRRADGMVDGICARILNAMSFWVNFTFSLESAKCKFYSILT